ncbi:MAG: hypothetical protein ACTS5G_02255, partial [Burkholderiales bacterium]
MNWRAKLQEQRGTIFQKVACDSLTKLTQPSFVGFVSNPSGHSENIAATPAEALKTERARLLSLAAAEWIDAVHVYRLHDADLAACLGLDDRQRAMFLHLLADTASRHAGRVLLDDTAALHCEQCGPVWVHPSIAAVLPVVDGWPRALGCPWCFVRKAGGYVPRPPVTCGGCRHFTPDAINPPAGMGVCGAGNGTHWPMQRHACGDHSTGNSHD